MILQGNRQDKRRLRNAGLAIFLVMNVVVIFVAQNILISEDREPIYNFDYIKSGIDESKQNGYDTARIAFLDLVNSPIPEYISGLEAYVKGIDPYPFGILQYNCPKKVFKEIQSGLPAGLLPANTDSGQVGLWNPLSRDSFEIHYEKHQKLLNLSIGKLADSLAFGSTQNPDFLHFFANDSIRNSVIHIAIRK